MQKLGNRVLAVGLINTMAFLSVWLATPVMQGCNSTTALADVEKFEPVMVNALNLACVISPGAALCGTMEKKITDDYNKVIQLWTDYNAAVAAGTSSAAWNDLNGAFNTFTKDSALIFAMAGGLNAPEITTIVASAQVLLATIEALFPAPPAGTVVAAARSGRFSNVKPLSLQVVKGKQVIDGAALSAWCKDYNGKLEIAHKLNPNARVQKVRYRKFLWL